jgi:hypothetical protein
MFSVRTTSLLCHDWHHYREDADAVVIESAIGSTLSALHIVLIAIVFELVHLSMRCSVTHVHIGCGP